MPAPSPALVAALKEAAVWEHRARQIKGEYDVLKTNKLRRTPTRETKTEGEIYSPSNRALGTNIGREI